MGTDEVHRSQSDNNQLDIYLYSGIRIRANYFPLNCQSSPTDCVFSRIPSTNEGIKKVYKLSAKPKKNEKSIYIYLALVLFE
jgi:hypothetical protein